MIWLAVELPEQPVLAYQTRTGQKRYQVRPTSPGLRRYAARSVGEILRLARCARFCGGARVFQIVGLLREESGCRVPTKRWSLSVGTESESPLLRQWVGLTGEFRGCSRRAQLEWWESVSTKQSGYPFPERGIGTSL